MRNLILWIMEQIIYRMSERTSKSVKYSERNRMVAKAALAVSELRKSF